MMRAILREGIFAEFQQWEADNAYLKRCEEADRQERLAKRRAQAKRRREGCQHHR